MKITSLFRPQGPKTAAEIAKAITQAEAARRAAGARLAKLADDRAAALLVSGDEEVDRIEAEQTATARELDRLDAALSELRRRLPLAEQEERSAARTKAWNALLVRHDAAAAAFADAAEVALAKLEALVAVARDAEATGFAHDVATGFAIPPALGGGFVIDRAMIAHFRGEHARRVEARKIKPAATAKKPAPPPAKVRTTGGALVQPHGDVLATSTRPRGPVSRPDAPRMTDSQGPASVNPAPVQRQPARPLLVVTDPPSAGKVAVRLLRSGVELAAGLGQSRVGDVIAIPADQARSMVERGAADFASDTDTTTSTESPR